MARVVIGLSGGVDSSVAAYLLKQQGHDVVGLFMINWHDTTGTLEGDCPWHDDRVFAELVAKKLDIPLHVVDLSADYRTRVVDYMFSEYEKGRTPNPDVLCNREIKFDVFLREALRLGANFVATGHYCRKAEETQLAALRPVPRRRSAQTRGAAHRRRAGARHGQAQGLAGHLLRGQGRPSGLPATEAGLEKGQRPRDTPHVAEIRPQGPNPGGHVPPTTEQLAALAAPWRYTVRDGKKIGEHGGAHFYTIGQRKGLGIGGRKESLFILATDTVQNVIYVGEGDSHPGLWRQTLHIAPREIHWVNPARTMPAGHSARFSVRIRYRQPLQEATLFVRDQGAYILFDTPQRGITPGQFAAWYDGDELVGSGVISE